MLSLVYVLLDVPVWAACICSAAVGHVAGKTIVSWWPESSKSQPVRIDTYREVKS